MKFWGIVFLVIALTWSVWYVFKDAQTGYRVSEYTDGDVKFHYKGDTLYWTIKGKSTPFDWLRFQLNAENPPAINREPIEGIWPRANKELLIWSKHYAWVLHYAGDPMKDWNVDLWGNQTREAQ